MKLFKIVLSCLIMSTFYANYSVGMITFRASDMKEGEAFLELSKSLAFKSLFIKDMIAVVGDKEPIPLLNITIAEFKRLKNSLEKSDNPKALESYLKKLTAPDLTKLIIDADYLIIDDLFKICLKIFQKKMQRPQELTAWIGWVEKNKDKDFPQTIKLYLARTIGQDVRNDLVPCWVKQKKEIKPKNLVTLPGATLVMFGADSRTLAIAVGNDIHLWDSKSKKERGRLKGHTDTIIAMAFSPNGRILATSGNDNTIRLWDVERKQERYMVELAEKVSSLAFSRDGTMLATGDLGRLVRIWQFQPGSSKELVEDKVLKGHTNWIPAVAFNPITQLLASLGNDNTVRTWDPGTGRQIGLLQGKTPWISNLLFNANGTVLASGSAKGKVYLWDMKRAKRFELAGHTRKLVSLVGFGPDAYLLASTSADKKIILWDIRTKALIKMLKPKTLPHSISFRADGKVLATVGQNNIVQQWFLLDDRFLHIYNPVKKSTDLSLDQALFLNVLLYQRRITLDGHKRLKTIYDLFDQRMQRLIKSCFSIS